MKALLDRGAAVDARTTSSAMFSSYVGYPTKGNFIAELIRFVAVAPADTATLRHALSLPMADCEDAMQVAAARACGARHIVTRNVRDFARSPIPAATPREALAQLF